jgi:hypothetical protein
MGTVAQKKRRERSRVRRTLEVDVAYPASKFRFLAVAGHGRRVVTVSYSLELALV